MQRYKPIKSVKDNNANMSTRINNSGEINSSRLMQNGEEVITNSDIAETINDNENKLISLAIAKKIINEYDKNSNPFQKSVLINDVQTLEKEKNEVHSKVDVLLDANLTPELSLDQVRNDLLKSLFNYENVYTSLVTYMEILMDINGKLDESYLNKFNELVDEYTKKITDINKTTQIATQRVMTLKSDKVLKIANENIEEAASRLFYKIDIQSSNGPFFRKNQIDTTLTAIVIKNNSENVTDDYNELQFRWSRISNNSAHDESWAMKARRGKSIHITNDDYEEGGCSFVCSLYDEVGRMIATSL